MRIDYVMRHIRHLQPVKIQAFVAMQTQVFNRQHCNDRGCFVKGLLQCGHTSIGVDPALFPTNTSPTAAFMITSIFNRLLSIKLLGSINSALHPQHTIEFVTSQASLSIVTENCQVHMCDQASVNSSVFSTLHMVHQQHAAASSLIPQLHQPLKIAQPNVQPMCSPHLNSSHGQLVLWM